jgi:tight adherence protein C
MNELYLGSALVMLGTMVILAVLFAPKPPPTLDIGTYRTQKGQADEPTEALIIRFAAGILRLWQPPGRLERLEGVIQKAGQPESYSVDRILAFKFYGGVVLGLLGLLVFTSNPTTRNFVFLLIATAAGFVVPEMLVSSRADRRSKEINDSLADAVDQLAVTVRAGLSVDAALQRVAKTIRGPISEELNRVVQDIQLGASRAEALRAMADRVELPELRNFVRALVQSDALGVPVSSTLELQAKDMRMRRRLRAEEQAMKLPVKILLPTVLFILPALLLVVLGPAAIQMVRNLS